MCAGLAAIPLPGQMPCCACGSAWSVDTISGLAYCARCEATGGKRCDDLLEKRTARKAAEKEQDRVVQTAMRFDPAS